jgi:hypothetical protein
MNPRKANQSKTRFIVDIGSSFSSLGISWEGVYGREKFLDVVFGIHPRAPGVNSTKPRMIRG